MRNQQLCLLYLLQRFVKQKKYFVCIKGMFEEIQKRPKKAVPCHNKWKLHVNWEEKLTVVYLFIYFEF